MLEALAARGGEEAGRVHGGWAHDSVLHRRRRSLAGSTPDWLHQTHSWWSSPRCRDIPLPPFRRPLADSCSPYAVIARSVLRVSCLWVLRPLLYWRGRSRFLFSCEVAFKVVFVFLTKQTGVDRCYVAGEQPEMDVIDPNLSIAVRSWSSFTSCLWENIRWFHVLLAASTSCWEGKIFPPHPFWGSEAVRSLKPRGWLIENP